MYCNACGKAIAEDGRFCSYCGNVVGIPPTPKKLMRLRSDRKIAGVCSGLAHYLELDVSLVRILWFFITLACGIFPGLVAYVLGWIIIPEEPLLLPSGSVATAGNELAWRPTSSWHKSRSYLSREFTGHDTRRCLAPGSLRPDTLPTLRSDDAEIFYEIRGNGPPVVLLHPFPCDHEFWNPVAAALDARYRLILPDLRGHGDSEIGEGPALMQKHAGDVARVLDAAGIGKAAFIGCSIGGYVQFEFWRRFRPRVTSLVLCDTRPQADTAEARANRLKAADAVLEQGTEPFIETMIPKLMGRTTVATRPDLVDGARAMMRKMSAEDISQVQRGMAERPDSVADLKTIDCAHADRDRRGRRAFNRRRRRTYAAEHCGQPVEGDSEGGTLCALGAGGVGRQNSAAVSG